MATGQWSVANGQWSVTYGQAGINIHLPPTISIIHLILLALFRDDVSGLLLFEDFAFSVTNLLCLGTTEIFVVHGLRNVHSGNIDLKSGTKIQFFLQSHEHQVGDF